ncbi:MAG TPA: hypothetical protein VI485_03490 [Vicinamibacterales bacterium]|nr:hypothetical protein [Vicinamibacterales bacterium]
MAVDDRGIVVGITTYPDFNGLDGPEHDAKEFYDWLTSPAGGDVPSSRVDYIVSSAFQPPNTPAPTKHPNADDVEEAFNRLHLDAVGATGVARRLGRRLYIYVAGHGAALPFAFDPDRIDAAFLVADASRWNATHVMARLYALYFLNAAIFDEVAVFMDCCRVVYSRLNPRFPTYIDINAINDAAGQRRAFFAFATKWALTAREKPIGGQPRGIFTAALMKGLKSAGANPDGTVTSSSLRNYLLNHMKDLLTPEELADPNFPKHPDIPPPAVELVFGTVPPPRVTVSVTFPAVAAAQTIRIRGEGFKVVASGQTVAGAPWQHTGLPRGGYLVEIPSVGLENDFTLIGDEGVVNVVLQ